MKNNKNKYKKKEITTSSDELISVAPEGKAVEISQEESTIVMEVIPEEAPTKINVNIEVTKEGVEFKEEKSIFAQETEKEILKEEKVSVFTQPEAKEIIPDPEKDVYYKITFIQEGKEKQYYTKKLPLITKISLTLLNAFEKITFKENVLNKRVITLNCKSNLDAVVELSLEKGLLLKVSQEEPWMALNKNNVEKAFNELVLNAYRELAVVPKPTISGLIELD